MSNKVILMCTECSFCETGHQEKKLLNQIKMWKHMKKDHPYVAEIMTRYKSAPSEPFKVRPA